MRMPQFISQIVSLCVNEAVEQNCQGADCASEPELLWGRPGIVLYKYYIIKNSNSLFSFQYLCTAFPGTNTVNINPENIKAGRLRVNITHTYKSNAAGE